MISAFHPYARPDNAPYMGYSIQSLIEDHRPSDHEPPSMAALQTPTATMATPMPHRLGTTTSSVTSVATAATTITTTMSSPSTTTTSPTASVADRGRRKRTTFSPDQAARLEMEYINDCYMARDKRVVLAMSLRLTENQVKTWFQNRRAKDKRDKRSEGTSTPSPCSRKSSTSPTTPTSMLQKVPPPLHISPDYLPHNMLAYTSTTTTPVTTTSSTSTSSPDSMSASSTSSMPACDLPPTPPLKGHPMLLSDYASYLQTFGLSTQALLANLQLNLGLNAALSTSLSAIPNSSSTMPTMPTLMAATPSTTMSTPHLLNNGFGSVNTLGQPLLSHFALSNVI